MISSTRQRSNKTPQRRKAVVGIGAMNQPIVPPDIQVVDSAFTTTTIVVTFDQPVTLGSDLSGITNDLDAAMTSGAVDPVDPTIVTFQRLHAGGGNLAINFAAYSPGVRNRAGGYVRAGSYSAG